MSEPHELSEDELLLREWWRGVNNLKVQLGNAKTAKASAEIAIFNLQTLLVSAHTEIAVLQRKGVKHFPVEEAGKGGAGGVQDQAAAS